MHGPMNVECQMYRAFCIIYYNQQMHDYIAKVQYVYIS